ncbi:hypothetical protein A3Q56_03958 [Intoshia linei]|uniref:Peptidyl-prolyl cis-trans isomerase n=1 Tax=Intoshia linei TaxID=1819745 RepID=A0A177B3K0_9BILA|nr:hypothetical protein A3Q56_03958 [Intoshia linei]
MNFKVVSYLLLILSVYKCAKDLKLTVTDEVILEFTVTKEEKTDYKATVKLALFGEIAPITVLNYVLLCEGYETHNDTLSYANSTVHRIVPDLLIQSGDVTNNDGSGSTSVYGGEFIDETFDLSHKTGVVSMANRGKDTNGSQFFITSSQARWMDGKHVVFGKVIDGMVIFLDFS